MRNLQLTGALFAAMCNLAIGGPPQYDIIIVERNSNQYASIELFLDCFNQINLTCIDLTTAGGLSRDQLDQEQLTKELLSESVNGISLPDVSANRHDFTFLISPNFGYIYIVETSRPLIAIETIRGTNDVNFLSCRIALVSLQGEFKFDSSVCELLEPLDTAIPGTQY